jgi:hypothetical protein
MNNWLGARSGPARCSACGAILADAVDDGGVVTVGELQVAFRRHTDHLVCPQCLVSYRVTDLLAARVTSR